MRQSIVASYSFGEHKRYSRKGNTGRKHFALFISMALAILFMATSVLSTISPQTSTVHAEDDPVTTFKDSASEYGIEGNEEGFNTAISKVNSGQVDENTFGYIIKRMLSLSYINKTETGVAASPFTSKKVNCTVNDPAAGTPLYHNCDVPNILTEFLQGVTASFITTGPVNANKEKAKVTFGFGLPSTIPNGSVPVNPSDRKIKYTALELFGYNMKYSSYKGEWDQIKVMNSARALSNFGMLDTLKLSATSVVNGVVGGIDQGSSQAIDNISQGDILGAIGGFFSGFLEGSAAASTRTILDSSDLNVFNTYAWYRVGYGNTLYRARELNQTEIAANISAQFDAMFKNDLQNASIPPAYTAIKAGPDKPLENRSKCMATKETTDDAGVKTSEEVEITSTLENGISEEDCAEQAKLAYQDDTPTWTIDGTEKGELIADWKEKNLALFTTANGFGIDCLIDDAEGNRKVTLDKFYACWDAAWERERKNILETEQAKLNKEWYEEKKGNKNVFEHFSSDPANNFNAPWNRFVCTWANGKDVGKASGIGLEMVYKSDGSLNTAPGCVAPRPPIQNAYYGNGYDTSDKSNLPRIDTRREIMEEVSVINIFLTPWVLTGGGSTVANFGLGIAKFTTQLTNATIDLAFSPILQKLGITDKVVVLIEAFKESIFYPFAGLIIAIGGLVVLIQAGKKKEFGQGIVSALLTVGMFVLGIAILNAPKTIMNVVEDVPSQIEALILGTVFSIGSDGEGQICYADQVDSPVINDLEGNPKFKLTPRSATRTLECEIWRVFSFNPWVQGQWGATYDQLYAENSGKSSGFNNTNTKLVGDASVNMGGGAIEKNWGLYQLDVLSSGTSTDQDFTATEKGVPRDFYRIVDAQAGPNDGAGTDGTLFNVWSGKSSGSRTMVGVLSAVVAIAGFVAIFGYAIIKIEITVMLTLMLLFLPFILLFGVVPGFGRTRLKHYAGTIIALVVQRIILVTMLAVMLKILTGIALAGGSYPLIAIISLAVCAIFITYRKEVLRMVTASTSSTVGGVLGQQYVDSPSALFNKAVPLTMRNTIASTKAAAVGGAGGFVAGYINNGPKGAIEGVTKSVEDNMRRTRASQRKTGIGAGTKVFDSIEAGKRASSNELNDNKELAKVKKDLQKTFTARNAEEGNGNSWVTIDPENKQNRKELTRLTELQSEIGKLEGKAPIELKRRNRREELSFDVDLDELEREQKEVQEVNKQRGREIKRRKREAAAIEEQLYARNNTDISYEQHRKNLSEAAFEQQSEDDQAYKEKMDDLFANGTNEEIEEALNDGSRDFNESMNQITINRQTNLSRMRDETARMKKQLAEARNEAWKAVRPVASEITPSKKDEELDDRDGE